jgi:hypothetical protein
MPSCQFRLGFGRSGFQKDLVSLWFTKYQSSAQSETKTLPQQRHEKHKF